MKKEVLIVVGEHTLRDYMSDCVCFAGCAQKLDALANAYCHEFGFVADNVSELWFYRGILIINDGDISMPYVVPFLRGGVCRFFTLRNAKSAITRYLNKKRGAK